MTSSSGGNFVSGVEEDLNVAVDEADDAAEMEKLMEEGFDDVLDRRSESEEPEAAEPKVEEKQVESAAADEEVKPEAEDVKEETKVEEVAALV